MGAVEGHGIGVSSVRLSARLTGTTGELAEKFSVAHCATGDNIII